MKTNCLTKIPVRFFLVFACLLVIAACTPPPPPPLPLPPPVETDGMRLEPVYWDQVPGWLEDDQTEALAAFLQSCRAIRNNPLWQEVCADATVVDGENLVFVRTFFHTRFRPYRLHKKDGATSGLVTGYYVPVLESSRQRTERFRYPLYTLPDDLLVIDLSDVYPDLKNYRLRGRLVGRKVVPYWSREEITSGKEPLAGSELFWVDDPVALFFLQIQGSGRLRLADGEEVMVHYADQNGHPYRSIGKLLIERGEMTRNQMSMQALQAWARNNPERTATLLNENPSFIFFEEISPAPPEPFGALGIPLTSRRSLAVDPRSIPLGAPVFLTMTWPDSGAPLRRLMVSQDTGGAIKGPLRADFFWGTGDEAGELAGRTKQKGEFWLLLPNGRGQAYFEK